MILKVPNSAICKYLNSSKYTLPRIELHRIQKKSNHDTQSNQSRKHQKEAITEPKK